jgi:alpha-glucoside transport system permease protein
MDNQDPTLGTLNATEKVVHDAFTTAGVLQQGNPSTTTLVGSPSKGFTLKTPLQPGSTAKLGLTAIPPDQVPKGARQAANPQPAQGAITGVVWRDFSPGGGKPGVVEPKELGLPGVTLDLKSGGKTVASTKSDASGAFKFDGVKPGSYQAGISSKTFAAPFQGTNWLGPKLINPAVMIAYIWVWAGFAMVIIAAGLASISREVLEAARTDGATEWQVFRRVTIPLLAPVLTVVFVTLLIYALKVFDLVFIIGGGDPNASVLAVRMWTDSFGGGNDQGAGSAVAIMLFLLVVPAMLFNLRRFRQENR